MVIMPTASPISLRRSMVPRSARRDSVVDWLAALGVKYQSCRMIGPVGCGHVAQSCARRAAAPPARKSGTALASKAAPEGAVECAG